MFCHINAALLLVLSSLVTVSGQTILDVIKVDPQLSKFFTAIELAGLSELLDNNDRKFTVFAPSNDAIDADEAFTTYMTRDGWVKHLKANCQLFIVPNQVLTDPDIFDGVTTELVSLNQTLAVSQPFASINLVKVSTSVPNPSQTASNGIVHTMEGVMKPYWREIDLWNMEVHDELVNLQKITSRIGFDEPLLEFNPSGTSWVASRNRGYGNDSIALGFYPIVLELTDPNNTEFQNLTYNYNLIDFNIYEEDIPWDSQIKVRARNGVADMWITKDAEGILRFNDAELDRQAFANNG